MNQLLHHHISFTGCLLSTISIAIYTTELDRSLPGNKLCQNYHPQVGYNMMVCCQGLICNGWNNHFAQLSSCLSLQLHGGNNSQIKTVQTNGSEIVQYPTRQSIQAPCWRKIRYMIQTHPQYRRIIY